MLLNRLLCAGALLALFHVGHLPAAADAFDALDASAHGFLDGRAGTRLQDDPTEKATSLAEIRLQLELECAGDLATLMLRSDFLFDPVPGFQDLDLETGQGGFDLREANLLFSPLDAMDLKIGRQILTWGRGDLVFINDCFPKDWQSFFVGRDVEYLKAPSDALFVSLFPDLLAIEGIDIAYSPRFDADRYVSGDRLSYWNPGMGSRAGRDAIADPIVPDAWFQDDEISVRAKWRIARMALEFYGYDGFWKSPAGMDMEAERPTFPALSVYGASVQRALAGGLISAEVGYYDSREETGGDDPFIPNSEYRYLVGYRREVMKNLNAGVQYYAEWMQDYGDYESALPPGAVSRDEIRQVITLRITKQALNQNLILSCFVYVCPTDEDGYVRPVISYKATDDWLLTAGGNLFWGAEAYTFFGQFEKNNNVYGGARYNF